MFATSIWNIYLKAVKAVIMCTNQFCRKPAEALFLVGTGMERLVCCGHWEQIKKLTKVTAPMHA